MEPRSNFDRPSDFTVGAVYQQPGSMAKRKLLSIYSHKGKKHVSYEVVEPRPFAGRRGNYAKPGQVRHVLFHAFQNWLTGNDNQKFEQKEGGSVN